MSGGFDGKMVLIAEDEAAVAMMLVEQLRDMGFGQIRVAASVKEATEAVAAAPLDVALLDIHLADGVSIPLAHTLRQRGVPAVFMSGNRNSASDVEFLGLRVIEKPFAPAELQNALATLLK